MELVEALATVRKGHEVDVVSACEAAEGVHFIVDVDRDLCRAASCDLELRCEKGRPRQPDASKLFQGLARELEHVAGGSPCPNCSLRRRTVDENADYPHRLREGNPRGVSS